ncbi:MAG: flap endonuclease-1 [Nanoarchaeota archaeon]
MGVQLSSLVIKRDISLEDLRNKKIAIDFSNVVYQFLASIRQRDGTPLIDSKGRITSHLMGIFTRSINLIENGIKVCYVFDGKSPLMKKGEHEEREHRKIIAEERLEEAKREGNIEEMYKYSKQTIRLSKGMLEESKELIRSLGLPIVQAPSEAEAQAAFMCENGDVYAVGSQDYDSLLFGAPRLIQNLTLSQKRRLPKGGYVWIKPQITELDDVLKNLGINNDQLIVLAILIGTDFNVGGVKGIGPKTALRLVKQHKNFDALFNEVKAEFDWKKVYAIFKNIPVIKNYQLRWDEIDEYKLKKLLVDEHEFSEERVDKLIKRARKRDKRQSGLKRWF